MLHCTQFLHWNVQLVLEHVCHGQLVHLERNNICSCTYSSVGTILPTRIRKSHQVVLGLNIGLSQEISHWCIIQISILFQAQMKKSAIEVSINYVSYFMSSMALDARARLKVNEIVPRVGLHRSLMR